MYTVCLPNFKTILLNFVQTEDDFVSKIRTSDEAYFHLSGSINQQNLHFWDTVNPHIMHEDPLHSLKLIVCCGICGDKVIGHYFLNLVEFFEC